MLDQMRKHSRSFIIYIFFGIIIAVFVVNFGPQSQGCGAETSYAGQINGEPLTVGHLRYALSVAGFSGRGMTADQMARLRAYAIDRLVVRELMAEQAHEMGLRIPDKKIREMLLDGRYLALGMERRLFAGDDESFDYERFSKFVRFNWRITVRKFKGQQRRELLAEQLTELMRVATKVSPEEALRDFVHRNTRADLQYVRFDPRQQSASVEPTPAQVAAFAQKESERIQKHFDANKVSYTNRPEELLLQVIAIDYQKAGGKDAAQKKAETLRQQLVADASAFAELARQHSSDASAAKGGALGWVKASQPGFGQAAVDALKSQKDRTISAVVGTDTQALLFRIEGRRQGDLKLEQVRSEIARKLLGEQLADDSARALASGFIKQLQGGKKLEELFASDESAAASKSEQPAGDEAAPRPKLLSTGPFERSAEHLVPGIGISEELTQLAFSLDSGALIDHPVSVGSVYYLVTLKEREDANMEEWNSRKDELVQEFGQRKWAQSRTQFETDLCELAVKEKRVQIDPRAISPGQAGEDPSQSPQGPAYVPCKTLKMM